MTIVLCNGCFDLTHAGHIAHLKSARRMAERLIVALTVDECVNKGAGRPIYPWTHRADILRELRCVDEVIPSRCGAEAILKVKPNVFCKGLDYLYGGLASDVVVACARVGAEIRFTKTMKLSTTEIMRRIAA